MYPGYIAITGEDPFETGAMVQEIVNTARAYAYAANVGIGWLEWCDDCEPTQVVVPGGPKFSSPIQDPAPWYDVNDPDSWGFLGVFGLEVTGAESSTRQAEVSMGLRGIGVIGPSYMAPRELVVRVGVIATDECSLQWGIAWLRRSYINVMNACGGDRLTFFECCPCVCINIDVDDEHCWIQDTYAELHGGPTLCDVSFWPGSYNELISGPPLTDDPEGFCSWPTRYEQLPEGPPTWTCCSDDCVLPYVRQLYNTRVTTGPTMLSHPQMNSGGAFAEMEFTVVAADPVVHSMPVPVTGTLIMSGGELVEDEVPSEAAPDPWLVGAA